MIAVKAAVLRQIGIPVRIEDVDMPHIGPDDVLVETKACGICGTDLHICDGWGYTPDLPFIMGHEPAGVVAEVGSNVTRFRIGDRVVPNIFFLAATATIAGRTARRSVWTSTGSWASSSTRAGTEPIFGFRARQLFHLPEHIAFTEGSIIADAVVTAVHAARRGRVRPGETVMVISAGGCGSAAIQECKAYGVRVFSVVRSSREQHRARELGADEALNSREVGIPAAARDLTEGLGVDCVIDAVGSEKTLRESVDSLARGGRLVLLGYTQERYPLDPRQTAVRQLEILGTRSGVRQDTVEAIGLVSRPHWKSIVAAVFSIEQVNEAHRLMQQGEVLGRIVLTQS